MDDIKILGEVFKVIISMVCLVVVINRNS